jgi:hypothetical protein
MKFYHPIHNRSRMILFKFKFFLEITPCFLLQTTRNFIPQQFQESQVDRSAVN